MDSQIDASERPAGRPCRAPAAVARARAGARRRGTRACARLVRQCRRGQRAGRRRNLGQRARRRRHLPPHGQSGQHTPRLSRRRPRLVRLVRPARPPSPARLRPGCRCLPRRRTRPQALARNPETAPGRDPLFAPRRRLPGADRRCLRLGDLAGITPRGRQKRPWSRARKWRPRRPFCAACWRPSPATCGACATGPSSWSASPARCGARSWRRSASSIWRRPTAASG